MLLFARKLALQENVVFSPKKPQLSRSTLWCIFREVIATFFLGCSNLVVYNSNAFEKNFKLRWKGETYILIFPILKRSILSGKWTLEHKVHVMSIQKTYDYEHLKFLVELEDMFKNFGDHVLKTYSI
jgi:hypothetical protein